MSDKIIENNQVTIMGEIISGFTFSHEVFGEGFYMVDVRVRRLSNSDDIIPLMISERLIDVTEDYTGEYIMASGQLRCYIGKHLLGERLQMCCLQSTALTESQITFHVSVGEGMQDMLPDSRWENMSRFSEESRAESI